MINRSSKSWLMSHPSASSPPRGSLARGLTRQYVLSALISRRTSALARSSASSGESPSLINCFFLCSNTPSHTSRLRLLIILSSQSRRLRAAVGGRRAHRTVWIGKATHPIDAIRHPVEEGGGFVVPLLAGVDVAVQPVNVVGKNLAA